jgi:2-methylisocitrate lyase-like PEP mutase family enzyme
LTLAARLRVLHRPGQPLLLANAWDVASARAIADAGLPAVATTSAGIAATLGYRDGEDTPVLEMLALVARIAAAVEVPVTADLESGYGLDPETLAARVLETGVVGLNYEDSDHAAGGLRDAGAQAERISALRAAAGDALVINARVDTHLPRSERPLEEGLRRAQRYLAAGADCVYPILAPEDALARYVAESGGPVNAMLSASGPSIQRLAELGVARISVGGQLQRASIGWLSQALRGLLAGEQGVLA